jgi:SET domain-containing protein
MNIKPFLYVKEVEGKGRGVFTKEPISKGIRIEESPVIVLSKKESELSDQTKLHNYLFLWGERQVKTCMALGYCSVYNHSYDPNCDHEMDFEKETMLIRTRRDIKKGEELTINYNGELKDKSPLWFKVK